MASRERTGKAAKAAPSAGASAKKQTGSKRPKAKSKPKGKGQGQGQRPAVTSPIVASPATPDGAVKVTFLGGLGEIGRNCACIEVDGKIMLIDCGLMFPDLDMLGIDLVLPDFEYLRQNADRIVGCIATHGHEDHVGGLSFLLRELSFPIYGSALTLALARNRIDEAGLARPHRVHPRCTTASGARSARSTASSSPSPTRCPTGSPPPSTRPRA